MKLLYGISVAILATLIVSCERKNIITTSDNKSSSTVCIASHCESNVDTKSEVNHKQQIADYQLECRRDIDGTGEYILVMVVGEKTRGLLGITTGLPVWGYPYGHKIRCEQVKSKTILGINAGASGWSSASKNGYPIICSSYKGRCLKDANGEIMEIATFRRGLDAAEIAKKFTNRFSNIQSAYDDIPLTAGYSELISF
jgi:hypothetical protein